MRLLTAEEERLGRVNFEAYTKRKGGRTYDDKPIPPWHLLSDDVREGWIEGARAVYAEILILNSQR